MLRCIAAVVSVVVSLFHAAQVVIQFVVEILPGHGTEYGTGCHRGITLYFFMRLVSIIIHGGGDTHVEFQVFELAARFLCAQADVVQCVLCEARIGADLE